MQILDKGHRYLVAEYDGDGTYQVVKFMKREGEKYPGNRGHHSGTNCQELLRILIDRVKYMDGQIPCSENEEILTDLRDALVMFEIRAARRHELQVPKDFAFLQKPENVPTCKVCGHVTCGGH